MLVSKNKEKSITEFILVQHALQLFPSLDNTIAIVAIDDEDNTLSVLEVMSPERTDLVLTTDIPHGKLNVLVFDSLDVETFTTDGSMSVTPSYYVPCAVTRHRANWSGAAPEDKGRMTDRLWGWW